MGSGKLSKIQVRDRIVKQGLPPSTPFFPYGPFSYLYAGIKLPLSYTKKQEKTQAKL